MLGMLGVLEVLEVLEALEALKVPNLPEVRPAMNATRMMAAAAPIIARRFQRSQPICQTGSGAGNCGRIRCQTSNPYKSLRSGISGVGTSVSVPAIASNS